jgi:dolichol-phosphate mannosyltransferase
VSTTTVPAPPFEELVFRPKRTRYCLAVFVLNEGDRIRRQIERMRPLSRDLDIVIADGGSSDGALEPRHLEEAGMRALLVKRGAGRLGTQMRMAFAWALQSGYDGLITIDGNGKDDPSEAMRFVEALDAGFEHVQGSRFIDGGEARNTPAARWLGIQLLHAPLISLAARFRYTDTTNGFRAYSARLLRDERIAPLREVFAGYELHYYLAIRAARLGYRVTEVPVTRVYPQTGKTPTKISGWRGNIGVLRTLVRTCLGEYDVPPPSSLEDRS